MNNRYPGTEVAVEQQIALLCLLDLYIYTTNKYPNVKKLSWAINYRLSGIVQ